MALPAVAKLKLGYTWKTLVAKMEVSNKIISLDGKVAIEDFKMEGLLVLEQTMGETKIRSYFKKGIEPIAVATLTKENEEKFIYHLKQ